MYKMTYGGICQRLHLMVIFQNNPGKLVPECLHSGLYRS